MDGKDDEIIYEDVEDLRDQILKAYRLHCDVIEELNIEIEIIVKEINDPNRSTDDKKRLEELHDKRSFKLKGYETQRKKLITLLKELESVEKE